MCQANCDASEPKITDHYQLACPGIDKKQNALDIQDAILVPSAEVPFRCAVCQRDSIRVHRARIEWLPSTLVVRITVRAPKPPGDLVRAATEGSAQLDLSPLLNPNDPRRTDGSAIYDLCSATVYAGNVGGSSGHYMAMVKRDGMWYECNDSSVDLVGSRPRFNYFVPTVVFYKSRADNARRNPQQQPTQQQPQQHQPMQPQPQPVEVAPLNRGNSVDLKNQLIYQSAAANRFAEPDRDYKIGAADQRAGGAALAAIAAKPDPILPVAEGNGGGEDRVVRRDTLHRPGSGAGRVRASSQPHKAQAKRGEHFLKM